MPWKETYVMREKIQLIEDWLSRRWTKTELSIKYEVSRPTINKWIKRFSQNGYQGLKELSRRPLRIPNETAEWQQSQIVATKQKFKHWGPKKVNDHLNAIYPEERWPADSTTGEILKRHGLVKPKSRNQKVSVYPEHLTESDYPNHVWNIDFKGDVKLGDGSRCYPLTVSDDYSRYCLCCQGLESTARVPVKQQMERLFREFGLPEVIKSDNGVPFASRCLGGLSQLSVWWIKLGILPERIDKGKPTQNGRHERLHRTLKEAVMKPPKQSMKVQQRAFEQFRYEYNELRSHESLERQTPSSVFKLSKVAYSESPFNIDYDVDKQVRKVKRSGEIKWKGRDFYIAQLLAGESIGLKSIDNERYEIYYSFLRIGYLNEKKMRIEKIKSRT